MKKALLLVWICLLVVSLMFSSGCLEVVKIKTSDNARASLQLKKFSSYEVLKSFVKTGRRLYNSCVYYERPFYNSSVYYERAIALAGANVGTFSKDYSTTNIQVEGVDEADLVKTDGKYLYIVSGEDIVIVDAYPAENATTVAWLTCTGVIRGIFINSDRLVVLGEIYSYRSFYKPEVCAYKSPRTFIKVYDVSNHSNPILTRNVSLDANYFNSRTIQEYAYIVAQRHAYLENDTVILPELSCNGKVTTIPATEIYYCNVSERSYTFTTIVAVNVQNDQEEPSYFTALLSSASSLYVSLENIYLAVYKWQYSARPTERTLLYRIHLEGAELELVASGKVPGRVLNQFSMDEHNGYFRIATTTGGVARVRSKATSENRLYVLDMSLNTVGSLTNLAPGEKIYSARFIGERCYLVTFKKVDPLFVIDLKNPTDPEVLGALKITGYSDYLHPYCNDYLIGIGKETVAAEQGDFAWYQGVKISLFNVSDVKNPKELAKYVIGDRGTESLVLRDHKALLFDKFRGLLVIPVLVAELNESRYPNGAPPCAYGDYVWQGVYVFNISLEGLVVKGLITHLENNTMPWHYSPYQVKRSLYIGDVLYTVSDKKIKMNSLENLDEINELELRCSKDIFSSEWLGERV